MISDCFISQIEHPSCKEVYQLRDKLSAAGTECGKAEPESGEMLADGSVKLSTSPVFPSRLIQLMSGDSDLTSVGPGTPSGAAQSTLSKSHSACINARDL